MLLFILLVGFCLRLALTNVFTSGDVQGYILWAEYLQDHRMADVFEFLPGGYPPYPPAYYYVLKMLGSVISLLGLWETQWLVRAMISLPQYLADAVLALLIYKVSKRTIPEKQALLNLAFYYFNPAILFTSSFLGQVDSLLILLGFLTLVQLYRLKIASALFIYTAALLFKPQGFALISLVGVLLYQQRRITRLKHVLPSLSLGVLTFAPIVIAKDIVWTVKYFMALPHWYPYTSVYAFSIWSVFGFLLSDSVPFLGIPMRFWGLFLYAAVSIFIVWRLLRNQITLEKVLYAAFLLFFAFALVSTRIHSRYFIYTIGFFAPFFVKNKLLGLWLSLFVGVNLLLPEQSEPLTLLVKFLNSFPGILTFVLLGGALFIASYKTYINLLTANEKK